MVDVKKYAKEKLEFIVIIALNIIASFIISVIFTLAIWGFRLILKYCGLENSLPFIIISSFVELEGICFLIVFIIFNLYSLWKVYNAVKKTEV
jgi:hypothetical protein